LQSFSLCFLCFLFVLVVSFQLCFLYFLYTKNHKKCKNIENIKKNTHVMSSSMNINDALFKYLNVAEIAKKHR
jgi:hypothetical protein